MPERTPEELLAIRSNDAFQLAATAEWSEYARDAIEALRESGLVESIPVGAPTVGGGMLITFARLYHELHEAFEAGRKSVL